MSTVRADTGPIGFGRLFSQLPVAIDAYFNRVSCRKTDTSERARDVHDHLFIVDLHADSLLWQRDLLIKNKRGHVDIPRLIAGNVALQVFTIVTKMPKRLGVDPDQNNSDLITTLSRLSQWPSQTRQSLKERVLYQIRKLRDFAQRSNGRFRIIETVSDLDAYLADRRANRNCTAGIIGIEGAHALEGVLENIDVFFHSGVRMMSPSHFFDNDMGGSSHGLKQIGLTAKGKEMIRRMQAKSMIVDLSHASSATIQDVIAIYTKPVVVSHTGVRGVCDSIRNLSDEDVVSIAKAGGIIGIGYWPQATGGHDAQSIAKSIRYTADLVGVEHVALGSDFDGACKTPFDAAGLPILTQTLLDEKFDNDEIECIMGKNALRVFHDLLPRS